ncbi:9,11-endoperoxide prostaglandin H2 reductase [Geodia barretti]|uniref:9,11-endoperoxide prostaglandin H2 reductase n=1 Tax=Geodia barretti TaxID=519541 RepID=A0AA35RSP7_GEOBA|nr:9,11-endoperoxide prostaglandin H2 reductase [Geodia barretti]
MAILRALTSRLPLRDSGHIPVLGLGVYLAEADGETEQACLWALKHGYRHIDTAQFYRNEKDVGNAIRKSGIPREEIFVTTKVWNSSHGKENTVKALNDSLKLLGLEYVDLYLMHSPLGGKVVETWETMVQLQKQGLVKSIGVSNFNVHHLEGLKKACPDHIPSVNQFELHPFLDREDVISYCQREGIIVESYSPITKGKKLGDPTLVKIAKKLGFLMKHSFNACVCHRYNKTAAQVLIRWCLDRNFVVIPKSVREQRIVENADVFDFQLSPEDLQSMSGLKSEELVLGWNPLASPWEP